MKHKQSNAPRVIVKVQWPIMGTGDPTVLIYNEDHTLVNEVPAQNMTKIKPHLKDGLKGYFYAHVDEKKILHIDNVAPWQEW